MSLFAFGGTLCNDNGIVTNINAQRESTRNTDGVHLANFCQLASRTLMASTVVGACVLMLGCTEGKGSGGVSDKHYSVIEEAIYLARRVKHAVWSATGLSHTAIVTDSVRFVKFEADSEINGGPWTAIAEFNLLDAKGRPLSRANWSVTADSVAADYPAANILDGDPNSFWHSKFVDGAAPPPHALVIDLGSATVIGGFSYLPRQDSYINGSVARYRFFASNDGIKWGNAIAIGNLADSANPRAERTVVFASQPDNHSPVISHLPDRSTSQFQPVEVIAAAQDVDGDSLEFSAAGLPDGIVVDRITGHLVGRPKTTGVFSPVVTVTDTVGNQASTTFSWAVTPAPEDAVSYVRLEALTEVTGAQWTAVAEFNLIDATGALVPRNDWTVSADNAQETTGPQKAIDGDVLTIWHTQWSSPPPPLPHNLIVNLGGPIVISGFRYLPRQDETRSGTIGLYRFYVSKDGVQWGPPVVQGDFASFGVSNSEKTVYLK